jgi:hypothetical protein
MEPETSLQDEGRTQSFAWNLLGDKPYPPGHLREERQKPER